MFWRALVCTRVCSVLICPEYTPLSANHLIIKTLLRPAMAQRSITSFFSAKTNVTACKEENTKPKKSPKKECDDREDDRVKTPSKSRVRQSPVASVDSPSPVSVSKRRRVLIESDSDSDTPTHSLPVNTSDGEINNNRNVNGDSAEAKDVGNSDAPSPASAKDACKGLSPEYKSDPKSKKPVKAAPARKKGRSQTSKRASKSPAASSKLTKASVSPDTAEKDTNRAGRSSPPDTERRPSSENSSCVSSSRTDGKQQKANKSDKDEAPSKVGIFGKLQARGPVLAKSEDASSSGGSLDENSFDPSRSNYHPETDAVWRSGQKVPYLALARTFELIESISGRLKTIETLANYFRSVIALSPDDLLPSVYLCLNQLAPAYHGVELGIGETVIVKALAQATGRTVDKIRQEVSERGDLGLVAEVSKSNQRVMFKPASLTVAGVFRTLKEIAQLSGHAVMNRKTSKMQSLLVACRHSETRYIARSLAGKLRIGLAEQSVLQALGQACAMTPPGQTLPLKKPNHLASCSTDKWKSAVESAALHIKTAHCECPSYDEIIPVLLQYGVDQLSEHCSIRASVPLKPMLAHPTKGVSEVLSRFEGASFTCEYKYDGERAQIHLGDDGQVRVFSRNQEDNTTKYPDIVSRFRNCLTDSVKSCIVDSEAVAWDTEKQQILPFQVLSTRKRKDADGSDIKIQVQVFAFDLLFLNGESLVSQPFQERRDKLKSSFKTIDGEFTFAKSMDSNNVEDIAEFLDESVKGNCEGLMVKTLQRDATYEIAKRSRNWLKLKKDYLDGVGDTIDVVVLGGFLGKGKRTGLYGGFLLGCYDPDNEEFQSICKIGTGFSDEDLQKHAEFFKPHVIDSAKSYYRYSVEPDHWFDAVQVWEIKCADLSVSPVHKAAVGLVDPQKGISLRFPRFLRIRDDKNAEQATSAQQIADMYKNQDQVKNKGSAANKMDEEDFY